MSARLIIFVLVVVSVGCSGVGPDYTGPPKVAHSPGFAGGRTAAGTVSPDKWWRMLGSSGLNRLVKQALEHNHDLQIAAQRLREARALRRQAGSSFLPRLGANLSFTRLDIGALNSGGLDIGGLDTGGLGSDILKPVATSGFLENPFDYWGSGIDVAWEIDVFGGRRREVRGARARAEAVGEALLGVRHAVAAEVAETYYTIAGLRAQRASVKGQVNLLESQADDVRERWGAGASSRLDVDRAVARLETTRAQLPGLDAGITTQLRRMAVLLGERPDALDGRKIAEGSLPAKLPMVRTGLPAELVLRRPDLRQAERELAAATQDIGVAIANFYPKFKIGGGPSSSSGSLSNLFNPSSVYWQYGPRVEWALFTGGANRAVLEGANARQKAALLNYEKRVLAAIGEVESALANLRAETRRLAIIQRARSATADAAKRVRGNYDAGSIDYLEVLIEEERLRVVEITEVRVKSQMIQVWVRLHKALGGGW